MTPQNATFVFLFALAGVVYLVYSALTGSIRTRGGATIDRRTQPFAYWTAFTVACLFVALSFGLAAGLSSGAIGHPSH